MEFASVDNFMKKTGLADDPAFEFLHFLIEPIQSDATRKILGLYYPEGSPDQEGYLPPSTIILPPDVTEGTLLHELGHRHGDYYHNDLSELYAEEYRMKQQAILSPYFAGSYARTAVKHISQEMSRPLAKAVPSVSDWSFDGVAFDSVPASIKYGDKISFNLKGFINELRDAYPDFWQVAAAVFYNKPDYTIAMSDAKVFQSGLYGVPLPYSKRIGIFNRLDPYSLGSMPNRNIIIGAQLYANHDHRKVFTPFDYAALAANGWEYLTALVTPVLVDTAAGEPGRPGWQLFKQTRTSAAATYTGRAQEAVFTFSTGPDQLDFINRFFLDQLIAESEKAVAANSPGDELLAMSLYRNTSSLVRTDYELHLIATDITGDPLPWAIIIVGVLALIAYWLIIRPAVVQITDLIWGPEGKDGQRAGALSGPLGIAAAAAVVLLGIALVKDSSIKSAWSGK